MSYGLLLLRVVVGGTMAAHGAQKLFGWFDGPGLDGVKGMLGNFGFRFPGVMALGLALTESAGLLFALGFLTPLAALGIVVVMLNLLTVAAAVTATGPGRFSVDRALHWDDNLSGVWWGVGVLGAAILISSATVILGRRRHRLTQAAAT